MVEGDPSGGDAGRDAVLARLEALTAELETQAVRQEALEAEVAGLNAEAMLGCVVRSSGSTCASSAAIANARW